MHQENLKQALVAYYGEMIEKDYNTIELKISAVIVAHCFAGEVGDNPLCEINRSLKKLVDTI